MQSNGSAIIHELTLGEVATPFRTSGFGVETVQCKDLSFTVWGVGGQAKVHPLWRHFYQGPRGQIYVANSTDLNKVVDAEEELKNLVKNETLDAIVLALANTHTPFVATCSGQKLSDVRMNEDLWCGMLMKQAVTLLSLRAKSRLERRVLDFVKLA